MKKIIDPLGLERNEYPVFANSIDLRGFMGFAIRAITGNVNHSMLLRRPGFVCSQSWTYKEIPLSIYLTKKSIVKFWICVDITKEERQKIMALIYLDLGLPWWKKMYDWPGVIGQAIGLRGFNIPGLKYCSERISSKVRILIPDFPPHANPAEVEEIFSENKRMKIYGYWMGDKFVLDDS